MECQVHRQCALDQHHRLAGGEPGEGEPRSCAKPGAVVCPKGFFSLWLLKTQDLDCRPRDAAVLEGRPRLRRAPPSSRVTRRPSSFLELYADGTMTNKTHCLQNTLHKTPCIYGNVLLLFSPKWWILKAHVESSECFHVRKGSSFLEIRTTGTS